ncbi:hypothetical protein MASR1M12_00560 [Erysipelotrichia bacterium]
MSSLTFNEIVAGNFPVIATRTLAASASARPAGLVLGKVTEGGLYAAYDNTKNDGTETARAILLKDVPAGDSSVQAAVLLSGLVVRSSLTGLDAAGETELADRGIHMDSES